MDAALASVYTDFGGVARLKAQARQDSDGALDEVAHQFEALLTQMMVKSMRQASLGEGLLDNDQTRFYRDMYDQQLSVHLAESGGMGLADVIKRQLGGGAGPDSALDVRSLEDYRKKAMVLAEVRRAHAAPEQAVATGEKDETARIEPAAAVENIDPSSWKIDDFVENLLPWAREAASRIGLAPAALLAQAALETGWGKHVMRFADGSPANNLFGIKADRRWDGARVHVSTLEFEQGVAVRKKAGFRAYESFKDSFSDYVDFLNKNPRYRKALASTDDAENYFAELQRAGYATDPKYAQKVVGVLESADMKRALSQLKNQGDAPL
jgi:flagellar protein FlgJ